MAPVRVRSALAVLASLVLAGGVVGQEAPTEPAAISLSDAGREQFLLSAEVLRIHGLSTGITGTKRVTLSDGKRTHDASFQTIDVFAPTYQTASGTDLDFRDSFKYNIAAYRLDQSRRLSCASAFEEIGPLAGPWGGPIVAG